MLTELARGISFTLATMLLFGGGYHGAVWAVGRLAFPAQAEGSLIRGADGTPVGSRLIAQGFRGPAYFHPRPSGVDYDAGATGGTNYGPSNPDHLKAVRGRTDTFLNRDHVPANRLPSEMVTASGSGLDPHIPPAGAEVQVERIASARGVAADRIRALVAGHTETPTWGFLGRARVNVLELNLSLDGSFGAPPTAGSGQH
jgi:K+-transporting ATPase ATPase C chain